MAEVRAFRGIRYDAARVGDLSDVVCAPYDIITPAAQAECYSRSGYNAVRVELARDEPGDDARQNRYTRAAAQLRGWLQAAVLRHEASPGLYVYEESFAEGGRSLARLGFFGAVRLEEWDRRIVLPHEWTMPKPRADRLSLLRACRANLSPIFSLYEDPQGRIGERLDLARRAAPVAEVHLRPGAVAAAAAVHRLWRLDDPDAVAVIQRELADRALYIADGHHRYETALEYWREVRQAGAGPDHPSGWVMMLLVSLDDPGLVALPTHRLVKAPNLDRQSFLRELRRVFTVEEVADRSPDGAALMDRLAGLARAPEQLHAFGVIGLEPGIRHVVTARPGPEIDRRLPSGRSPAWHGLDVAVLHSLVLEGLLGLGSEASGDGVTYTRDAAQAVGAVATGECDLAFLLNPTRVSQIRDVALAGDRMPEKSTYFWPKPPTGLVFYDHELPGTLG